MSFLHSYLHHLGLLSNLGHTFNYLLLVPYFLSVVYEETNGWDLNP